MNDALADNSKGYNWEEGVRDQGYCTFTGGSYHSIIPLDGTFHSCLASSLDFSNFAFEVQMTILSGNTGGIVFRASRATTHFYYFLVDRNGNYQLQPVIKGFLQTLSGTISGSVMDGTSAASGAVVTATYTAGANYAPEFFVSEKMR